MAYTSPDQLAANWELLLPNRPTWATLTTAELAKVLGLSHQCLSNWALRGKLPPPVISPKLNQRKTHYRISSIRSWLEGKTENEIHWNWVETHVPYDLESLEQAEYIVNQLYRTLKIEKPLISGAF